MPAWTIARTLVVIVCVLVTSLHGCGVPALDAGGVAAKAAARVRSVEPPNWWTGHTLPELQILIGGESLAGGVLASASRDVTIARQRVNDAGTHLIAYVRIAPDARPGTVALRVDVGNDSVPVPFELRAPLSPTGRFQGLTPDDSIYLVMPDRFANGDVTNDSAPGRSDRPDRALPYGYHGGDLAGLTRRLEYVRDLGFTAIWLTPWYDNDDAGAAYHGYHATDFYGVEERFGTLDELRAFVDRAHALGLKVIQDQVANHTGDAHTWVVTPPTATWLNGTRERHLDNQFDIRSVVDPNADPARRKATLEGWFGNHLPDINQNDPDAAAYLIQNSLWWIETTGIDAIRQDTMPYAPRSYWAAWMKALKARRPQMVVIGEVFNGDPKVVSVFQGGVERDGVDTLVDSVFDFPLAYPLAEYFGGERPATRVSELLAADGLYPNPALLAPFVGNHDTPRQLAIVNGDPRAQRLLQTCLFTMRGIPMLFYGDEIAMPGGEDPDNRRDFPGGFPGDARDAFSASGRTAEENLTFENLRRVLALRRAHPALRGPTIRVLAAERRVLVYQREGARESAIVAFNNADVSTVVEANVGGAFAEGAVLADALSTLRTEVRAGKVRIELPARTAAILLPVG